MPRPKTKEAPRPLLSTTAAALAIVKAACDWADHDWSIETVENDRKADRMMQALDDAVADYRRSLRTPAL